MIDGRWLHRDGLELHNTQELVIEFARKADGRGQTIGKRIFLGEAEYSPYFMEAPAKRRVDWYGVLAFAGDIHHGVMTPEQLRRLAMEATELAERVEARRAKEQRRG